MKFRLFLFIFFLSNLNASAIRDEQETAFVKSLFVDCLPMAENRSRIPFSSLSIAEKSAYLQRVERSCQGDPRISACEPASLFFSTKISEYTMLLSEHGERNRQREALFGRMQDLIPHVAKIRSDQDSTNITKYFYNLYVQATELTTTCPCEAQEISARHFELSEQFKKAYRDKIGTEPNTTDAFNKPTSSERDALELRITELISRTPPQQAASEAERRQARLQRFANPEGPAAQTAPIGAPQPQITIAEATPGASATEQVQATAEQIRIREQRVEIFTRRQAPIQEEPQAPARPKRQETAEQERRRLERLKPPVITPASTEPERAPEENPESEVTNEVTNPLPVQPPLPHTEPAPAPEQNPEPQGTNPLPVQPPEQNNPAPAPTPETNAVSTRTLTPSTQPGVNTPAQTKNYYGPAGLAAAFLCFYGYSIHKEYNDYRTQHEARSALDQQENPLKNKSEFFKERFMQFKLSLSDAARIGLVACAAATLYTLKK